MNPTQGLCVHYRVEYRIFDVTVYDIYIYIFFFVIRLGVCKSVTDHSD
jgi:hypothetical protein